jgi:hypothetical protein
MTKTNIKPEETLIYKELKSKFEVSDSELWKEVSENIKQVILDSNSAIGFEDCLRITDCFIFENSQQGYCYWESIARKLKGGKNWW